MKISYSLLCCILLLILSGCTAAPQPQMRVLWPPPPDEPRLEFLGSYASEDDFPKSASQVAAEAVLGKPHVSLFKMPFDAVLDSKGRVYVSDLYLGNIRVYDFEAKTNNLFTDDMNVLSQPLGMAIDSRDRLYVADGAAGRIVVFGSDRTVIRMIQHPNVVKPAYLFVDDSKDRLYVSDGKDSKIAIFDLAGNLLKTFGQDQIYSPQGIAVSSDGRIFVAESLLARISVFSPEGVLLEQFGERGDSIAQFEHPKDLAFGDDDMLYVLDARRPGLFIFDKNLQALLVLSTNRQSGLPLAMDSPSGLFVSASGKILIADRLKRRFSIWQFLTPQYLAEHPVTQEDLALIQASQQGGASTGEVTK